MKSAALFPSVFDAKPFMFLSATADDASMGYDTSDHTHTHNHFKAKENNIKLSGSLFHP